MSSAYRFIFMQIKWFKTEAQGTGKWPIETKMANLNNDNKIRFV